MQLHSGFTSLAIVQRFLSPVAAHVLNATEHWFQNRIDHLTSDVPIGGSLTFSQRYFVYDNYWGGPGSPIFFYCGNEADVELYVNATGLMWERAQEFNAMLVWGEHRYYGKPQPFGDLETSLAHRSFLSVSCFGAKAEFWGQVPNFRGIIPRIPSLNHNCPAKAAYNGPTCSNDQCPAN